MLAPGPQEPVLGVGVAEAGPMVENLAVFYPVAVTANHWGGGPGRMGGVSSMNVDECTPLVMDIRMGPAQDLPTR